jgi:hypothetical protein
MTHITVDVNDGWAAAAEIVAAFDGVRTDFAGSDRTWGYGGGRDLSRLAEDAREAGAARLTVGGPLR